MQTDSIELFHKKYCPYSVKVRKFIEANGLTDQIVCRDITPDDGDNTNLLRLQELTDDYQVPVLAINGVPLKESEQIIDWLRVNLVNRDKNWMRNIG